MANWKTAKSLNEIASANNISKEIMFDFAMAQLRMTVEELERRGRYNAEQRGEEYVPPIVYWDAMENEMKKLYNIEQ